MPDSYLTRMRGRVGTWSSVLLCMLAAWPIAALSSEIHDAARTGDIDRLGRILAQSSDSGLVISKDESGLTPLSIGIVTKNPAVVHYLITNTPCVYLDHALDIRSLDGERAKANGIMHAIRSNLHELSGRPDAGERVDFGLGLVETSLGNLDAAQAAFRRVVTANPANHRARAELARVYVLRGQPELAKKEIADASKYEMTPLDRRILSNCLNEGALSSSRKNVYVMVRMDAGYLDDSNINIGPDSTVIGTVPIAYGSLVFSSLYVPDEAQPRRTRGMFGAMTASGILDTGETDRWIWGGDISYYQNWLERDSRDNETLFGQVSVGPRYVTRNAIVAVPCSASTIFYGHNQLIDIYGLSPSYLQVSGSDATFQWLSSFTLQVKDYRDLEGRDSSYVSVGQSVRKVFGQGGHNVTMGVTVFVDSADEDIYSNCGLGWRLGTRLNLPWRTVLHAALSHSTTDYEARDPLAVDRRSDTYNSVILGMDKRIMGDWGIDLTFQHVDNNSTFALYQYERDIWAVSAYLVF